MFRSLASRLQRLQFSRKAHLRNYKIHILLFINYNTLTPALSSRFDASSGSKLDGIGCTGRSLVLIPRC